MSLQKIYSEIHGAVWKLECAVNDLVNSEDTLILLESMKMEIPVSATCNGIIHDICVNEGEIVSEGQLLLILEPI